jgi:hypothetical protein
VLLRLVGNDETFAPQAAQGGRHGASASGEGDAGASSRETAASTRETAADLPVTRPGTGTPRTILGRGRRGRRRRKRDRRLPAAVAALGIAAAAGGAVYGVLTMTSDTVRGTSAGGPTATSPAGSDAAASAAPTSRRPGGTTQREPAADRPDTTGTAGPSTPGGEPSTRGPGGGGDDPTPPSASEPRPVVLGSPDPERYCSASGDRAAKFRSGNWYCAYSGPDSADALISMVEVCRSQYSPTAEARLNGNAAVPDNWECYVLR